MEVHKPKIKKSVKELINLGSPLGEAGDKKRKIEGSGEKKKRVKVDSDDENAFVRTRTRSMSDAEETHRLLPSQTPEEFRTQHQITITGRTVDNTGPFVCPNPMVTFESTPFAPAIRRALDAAGFQHPTPTQAQSWPIALAGRDIITVAKTGSGKVSYVYINSDIIP